LYFVYWTKKVLKKNLFLDVGEEEKNFFLFKKFSLTKMSSLRTIIIFLNAKNKKKCLKKVSIKLT